ncbi:hypothetical protein GW17_00008787 [Ensete ventricosum]|nr:hypothetical protein GW17_00008787 [Ensete ventricosum]
MEFVMVQNQVMFDAIAELQKKSRRRRLDLSPSRGDIPSPHAGEKLLVSAGGDSAQATYGRRRGAGDGAQATYNWRR